MEITENSKTLKFDANGLIPAIVQDHYTKEVLDVYKRQGVLGAEADCIREVARIGAAAHREGGLALAGHIVVGCLLYTSNDAELNARAAGKPPNHVGADSPGPQQCKIGRAHV